VAKSDHDRMMTSTRQKLILATECLLRRDGLSKVTTRKIAREAGISEGALYHHFNDKAELLHAVVQRSMGDFREVLDTLPFMVGQGTVGENLEYMLQAAFDFHFKIMPIACSLFADNALLARTREILTERGIGPQRSVAVIAVYLEAEQRIGRVASDIASHAAAELLLAGSFHQAMLDHFFAREVSSDAAQHQHLERVRVLLKGLEPRPTENNLSPMTGI